jgi:hypothetical protein
VVLLQGVTPGRVLLFNTPDLLRPLVVWGQLLALTLAGRRCHPTSVRHGGLPGASSSTL